MINNPVTINDIHRSLYIYGPGPVSLLGRTTRTRPTPIPALGYLPLSPDILDQHPHITLSTDYFFVQGMPFLHTVSRDYHFRTCEPIWGKNKANKRDTVAGIKMFFNIYEARGLEVTQLNADNDFDCIREDVRPADLNIVVAN